MKKSRRIMRKRSSFLNRKKSRRQPVRKSRRKTTKKHSLKKSVRNKSRRRRSKSNRKKNDGTKKCSKCSYVQAYDTEFCEKCLANDKLKTMTKEEDISYAPVNISPPVIIDLSKSSPTEENRIIEEKRTEKKRKLSTTHLSQKNSKRKKSEETKKVCHICTAVNDISAEKCEVCKTYLIQEGCLQNLGQTCYLNATIQMMRDIRKRGLTFIDYPYKFKTSKLSKKIINDFIYLVKNDISNTEKLENVTGVFEDNKNQQDPSEFLSKIEDYLKLMKELFFTETSILNNRVSSEATNSSFLLSLEIPKSANNIGSCYKEYIKKVYLKDYKDEETGNLGGSKKIINNFSQNKFLIIQLKRFSKIEGKKLRQQITPEEKLSFSSVDFDNRNDIKTVNYKLIGVIIHTGDQIKSGHYTYYSYINEMLYNDFTKIKKDNIKSLKELLDTNGIKSLKELLDTNGYIFLYQKVDKEEEGCVVS